MAYLSKVSILIPCYNAGRWMALAIESALAQTYPNKEVIVVDDGSTDNSLEVMRNFSGRIIFETHSHRGANAVRNRLLELATGDWLQYLDADDYLMPDKIARQIDFLQTVPDADVIYSPATVKEYLLDRTRRFLLKMISKEDIYINFARWSPFQTCGPLWKKKALLDVGGWKEEQVVCQEHELLLRLIMAEKKFYLFENADSIIRQYAEYNIKSISRKDKKLTVQQRMALTDRLESYLKQRRLLNKHRIRAISLSRFECARYIYEDDRDFAAQIIKKIEETDSGFSPHGPAAPLIYRVLYQLIGFKAAEEIAKIIRSLRAALKIQVPKLVAFLFGIFVYYTGIFKILLFMRRYIFRNFRATIIVYHSISDFNPHYAKKKEFIISKKTFQRQLKYIKNNFRIVSLEELFQKIKNHRGLTSDYIVVTFDDGYEDNFSKALPVLKRYNTPAAFFIIPEKIGKDYHLNWEQVKKIQDAGFEIGSHALTHSHLTELDQARAYEEISFSKTLLEDRLNKKVRYFAYPYGEFNPEIIEMAKEAGYEAALSCIDGDCNLNTDLFLLKRKIILRQPFCLFVLKLI